MIRLTILYPNKEGARFDLDYYVRTHMPMAQRLLAPALKGMSVEAGISGGPPNSRPPFIAGCNFLFETAEAFYEVFAPNAGTLQGDIPNYTDIEPVIQISDVKMTG